MTFGFPEVVGVPLPPTLSDRYKITRDTHRDDPDRRACPICLLHHCPEWTWATSQLILSGERLGPVITPLLRPRLSSEDASEGSPS